MVKKQLIPVPHYCNYKKGISKFHCCKIKHSFCSIHNTQGKELLHSLVQLRFISFKSSHSLPFLD